MIRLFRSNDPPERRAMRTGQREKRVPPGQRPVEHWPVMHAGTVPEFEEENWEFKMSGLVEENRSFTWAEFSSLPRVTSCSDVHCVTGWSKLDNEWEGVVAAELLTHVELQEEVRFVVVHAEEGYTANMPLQELFREEVLFALKHNGKKLTPEHGFPVRLVVPQFYFWKSVKWVRGLEFTAEDRPGFWESRGYHNIGDPWKEQRYSN